VRNIDCITSEKVTSSTFLLHFPLLVVYNADFMFYAFRDVL
jgi:hypothetical protein